MTDYRGVTWRVNFGEIGDRDQFRVGRVQLESYDAYFEVGSLTDLLSVLANVVGLGLNQISRGTNLQARKVSDGLVTAVLIEPRLDTGEPSRLMSLPLSELTDLVFALQLLQADLGNAPVPDDWDQTRNYLLENGVIRESRLPSRLSAANLTAGNRAARGFTVDSDHSSLEAALAATPVGGILEVRETHARSVTFNVNKPCTVRFNKGKITMLSSTNNAIDISSDDVTLEKPKITGAGINNTGTARAIRALGTTVTPLKRIRISHPDIRDLNYIAIDLRLCEDVSVFGGEIQWIGYSAITYGSVRRGSVCSVTIHDVTQPGAYVNCYGVAITSWGLDEDRSIDCSVTRCTITNVPWEGIDTHGGENLLIDSNILNNCGNAIAIVGLSGSRSPKNVQVLNNKIADSNRSGGIVFVGHSTPDQATLPSEFATGTIIGNTLIRCGEDAGFNAAIIVYNTRGLVISGNSIVEPNSSAINLYFQNENVVVVGNTFTDVGSATLLTQAIFSGQHRNSGVIAANTLTRGSRVVARVNEYGLRFSGSATALNAMRVVGNKFDAATIAPVLDVAGAVRRPDITGSRGGNAALAALLTALDADYVIKNSTTA